MPRPGPRAIQFQHRLKPSVVELLDTIGREQLAKGGDARRSRFERRDGKVNRSAVVLFLLARADRRLRELIEPKG